MRFHKHSRFLHDEFERLVNSPLSVILSHSHSLPWRDSKLNTLSGMYRVGPDSIIKLLSSPSIALFQPLKNGCYVQISGNPVVELELYKEKEKELENGKKRKGRKVHVRACKKRGKRKKRSSQDEDGSEEELEQGNTTKKAKERGPTQEDRMEVDSTNPASATFVEPTQEVTSPRKKARLLGPSISAPSLLVTTDRIDRQSQPSQFPRTAAQSQLQVPSAPAMTGPNTQLNLATSLIKSNKGGSTTKIGVRQKKGTLFVSPFSPLLRLLLQRA